MIIADESWKERTFFGYRIAGAAFAMGGKGYFTTDSEDNFEDETWEFDLNHQLIVGRSIIHFPVKETGIC